MQSAVTVFCWVYGVAVFAIVLFAVAGLAADIREHTRNGGKMMKPISWEAAADAGFVQLLLSDARGIYLPQDFATSFVVRESSLDDAMTICAAGPDHADYCDAWMEILENGTVEGESGAIWCLHHDGDLFAIRADVEIDPDTY